METQIEGNETVKITLPLVPSVEIEIDEASSYREIGRALAEIPAVKEMVLSEARNSYFEAWTAERDMGDSSALEIARIYTEGGIDAVSDHAIEQNWDNSPDDDLESSLKDDIRRALRPIFEAIGDELGHDEDRDDEVLDAIIEELRDEVLDAMTEADKSTITDMIPDHTVVEIAFVPDLNERSLDDLFTSHNDVCSESTTVIPNANFLRFLKLVNVSVGEYIDIVRENGTDLLSAEVRSGASEYAVKRAEEAALEWRAVLDVEKGTNDFIRQLPLRTKYEIAEWNERVGIIATIKDFDRPAAVTPSTLMTIMDESSYGGAPAFICRLPLGGLLKGEFDGPFLAEGGFVGLHHFYNGSGYIERPDAPILIEPSKGAFHVHSTRKNAIDDVYGIVGSYYRIKATPTEVSPWQRVEENAWLRSGENGSVKITARRGDDGVEEYWVQSFDKDGAEAGPRATAEVFIDLDHAKEEGEKVLAAPFADMGMAP